MNQLAHQIAQKLSTNFKFFAEKNLKIRDKDGNVAPFIFNSAQQYIDAELNKQLDKIGKIRAIILKGRQQGCSTYVEGRYYWRTTTSKGKQAFILTQLDDATKNLFKMAKRFYEHDKFKPATKTSNANELLFDSLDSGYQLGTANSKAVGRSATTQYFHGSEVAYWSQAAEHAKGALQTVPDAKGTEIILESTSNGVGNWFHRQVISALKGEGDYILIFVPWFWQTEYRSNVPDNFELDETEIDLKELYHLDNEQLAWRRKKIIELSEDGTDGETSFKREYPNSVQEAFEDSDDASLIPLNIVKKAQQTNIDSPVGPRLLGVDPARFGNDRSSLIDRKGRKAYNKVSYRKKDTMQIANIVHNKINKAKEDNDPYKGVFVDVVGLGAGVVDRLRELGHDDIVIPVNAGEKAIDEDRYANKRAEMWGEMLLWLKDTPCDLPDDDSLETDLCGIRYEHDSKNRLRLEKKEAMKKRGLLSPDEAEALACTFAQPVSDKKDNDVASKIYGRSSGSNWMGR